MNLRRVIERAAAPCVAALALLTSACDRPASLTTTPAARPGPVEAPDEPPPREHIDEAPRGAYPAELEQRLAVALWNVCALEADGAVVCWGDEEAVESTRRGLAAVPSPVRRLAVHTRKTCVIAGEGQVYCWDDHETARPIAGVTDATDVALGGLRTCAALVDGRVTCWEWYGPSRPTIVSGVTEAVQIELGIAGACARERDGQVWCWGYDRPRPLPGVTDAVDIAVGAQVWVVHADGTVDMFGEPGSDVPPKRVQQLQDAVDVEEHDGDACARGADGGVSCWRTFDLDEPALLARAEPFHAAVVPGVRGAVELRLDENTACVRDAREDIRCWGRNAHHRLGDAAGGPRIAAPRPVTGLPAMTRVRVGDTHACAWDGAGDLWCWGAHAAFRQYAGDGWVRPRRVTPASAHALVGARITCFERAPGGFTCEGDGRRSIFGRDEKKFRVQFAADTTTFDFANLWGCGAGPRGVQCFGAEGFLEPVPVSPDYYEADYRDVHGESLPAGAASSVAVADDHACATTAAGAVLCWGQNDHGQVGRGAPRQRKPRERHDPVVVPDLPPMTGVTAGGTHTCGLTASGEAWCWGGQHELIEHDGYTYYDVASPVRAPTRVAGVPPLVRLEAGGRLDCGLDAGGGVWCWETNDYREHLRGVVLPIDPPRRVPGLHDAVDLHVDGSTACVVDRLGQVWCWGGNSHGQVDPSGPSHSLRPVLVAPARRVTVKPAPPR